MLICTDHENHMVMVVYRDSRKTVAIVNNNGYRRHKQFYNVEFDAIYKIAKISPIKVAEVWLTSTIPISVRAKGELEMIYAIKKNKVVSATETAPEELKGTLLVAGIDDLARQKMSTLVAIHNNCVKDEDKIKGFEDVAQAAALTFDVIKKFQIPEAPAKKEKAPKEPKEPRVTDRSRIRAFIADKDSFTIDQIVELVGGTKANASTTITLLIKPGKCGKEGPIPFAYDKAAKVYNRVEAAE